MTRAASTRTAQQTFEFRRPGKSSTRGGRRKGAGRKKTTGRSNVAHVRRERVKKHEPQLVTLRLEADARDIRRWRYWGAIVGAISKSARNLFQVGAWSIQDGHLHLVTEANTWTDLSNGVRALEIRLARAINKVMKRKGRVFADRYHARALATPTEVRNALVYVLQNVRKHLRARGIAPRRDWLDRFSSAPWFDGWKEEMKPAQARAQEEIARRAPIELLDCGRETRTWLLRTGWRRRGLIASTDVPAE